MNRDQGQWGGPPPWAGKGSHHRHGAQARARFFRRAGVGAAALFMLALMGGISIASRLAERASAFPNPLLPLARCCLSPRSSFSWLPAPCGGSSRRWER